MKSLAQDRWVNALRTAVVAGALCVGGTECMAQVGSGRIATQSVSDTLAELDQNPDQVVRVILSVKAGATDEVAAAAKRAGANGVNPLYSAQSVVVEGTAAQVRAAAETGQVLQIRPYKTASTD